MPRPLPNLRANSPTAVRTLGSIALAESRLYSRGPSDPLKKSPLKPQIGPAGQGANRSGNPLPNRLRGWIQKAALEGRPVQTRAESAAIPRADRRKAATSRPW
jgi:hypothetical protein